MYLYIELLFAVNKDMFEFSETPQALRSPSDLINKKVLKEFSFIARFLFELFPT